MNALPKSRLNLTLFERVKGKYQDIPVLDEFVIIDLARQYDSEDDEYNEIPIITYVCIGNSGMNQHFFGASTWEDIKKINQVYRCYMRVQDI